MEARDRVWRNLEGRLRKLRMGDFKISTQIVGERRQKMARSRIIFHAYARLETTFSVVYSPSLPPFPIRTVILFL